MTSGCLPPLLGALVLVAAWCLIVSAGHSQDDPTALLLARTCVSERGWRLETNDCYAIAEVARYRAEVRGGTIADALRALSPRLHGSEPLRSRPWLRDLDRDAHRPAGLGAPWLRPLPGDAYNGLSRRDVWLWTVQDADAILGGDRPSPCAERPRAWGSAADLARRRAAGYRWIPIDCGDTVNYFGRLLRRRDVDPE